MRSLVADWAWCQEVDSNLTLRTRRARLDRAQHIESGSVLVCGINDSVQIYGMGWHPHSVDEPVLAHKGQSCVLIESRA